MQTAELRKIKTIQTILHLQARRKNQLAEMFRVSDLQNYCDAFMDEWETENQSYIDIYINEVFTYFEMKPVKKITERLKKELAAETEQIQQARRRLNDTFFRSLKQQPEPDIHIPEKLKKKAAKVPEELRQLARDNHNHYTLLKLEKHQLDKIKLINEIDLLTLKISLLDGSYIKLEQARRLIAELHGLSESQFTQIPYRMEGTIMEIFGKTQDDLHTMTAELWYSAYEPALNVQRRLDDKFTGGKQ